MRTTPPSRKKTWTVAVAMQTAESPGSLLIQKWFPASDVSAYWGISVKTFRNAVSMGRFPRPTRTIFGPRWHIDVIRAVESGEWQPEAPKAAPRGRGRPRIAAGKGVQS